MPRHEEPQMIRWSRMWSIEVSLNCDGICAMPGSHSRAVLSIRRWQCSTWIDVQHAARHDSCAIRARRSGRMTPDQTSIAILSSIAPNSTRMRVTRRRVVQSLATVTPLRDDSGPTTLGVVRYPFIVRRSEEYSQGSILSSVCAACAIVPQYSHDGNLPRSTALKLYPSNPKRASCMPTCVVDSAIGRLESAFRLVTSLSRAPPVEPNPRAPSSLNTSNTTYRIVRCEVFHHRRVCTRSL